MVLFESLAILVLLIPMASTQAPFSKAINSNNTCTATTVIGSSTVNGTPDVVIATFLVFATANTSTEALSQMNNNTRSLLGVFSQFNVPLTDIQTTALTLGPTYLHINGSDILSGQQASQQFQVKLFNSTNSSQIQVIVDAISVFDGIEVRGLQLDISNRDSLTTLSSTNAWNDAYNKAQQYSQMAGFTLGRALTIKAIKSVESPRKLKLKGFPKLFSEGTLSVSYSVIVDFAINS